MSEKQQVIGAAGGAIGLSTMAAALAACCGVPWVVALFGVAGAVAFARLAFLFPYALAGAALLLALAFWLAYRRSAACDDESCEPANRTALRAIVWLTATLVAALTVFAFSTQTLTN